MYISRHFNLFFVAVSSLTKPCLLWRASGVIGANDTLPAELLNKKIILIYIKQKLSNLATAGIQFHLI